MPSRKPTILIVDDEPGVARTIALVVQHSGYAALAAFSGRQALALSETVVADLAIVDVNMPDLDGVRTAVQMCKLLPRCKILLISGDTEATAILENAKADGIEFPVLAKPVPPEQLLATVDSLLHQSRPQN